MVVSFLKSICVGMWRNGRYSLNFVDKRPKIFWFFSRENTGTLAWVVTCFDTFWLLTHCPSHVSSSSSHFVLEKRGLNPGKPGSLAFGLGGQMLGPSHWRRWNRWNRSIFCWKTERSKRHVFQDGYKGNPIFWCVCVCVREVACHANQKHGSEMERL